MLSKDTRKKLFVTTAARQRLDTPDSFYEPVNNPKLLYEYPNAYPILSAVNGYVDVEPSIIGISLSKPYLIAASEG